MVKIKMWHTSGDKGTVSERRDNQGSDKNLLIFERPGAKAHDAEIKSMK
jgi:hypothetical protein